MTKMSLDELKPIIICLIQYLRCHCFECDNLKLLNSGINLKTVTNVDETWRSVAAYTLETVTFQEGSLVIPLALESQTSINKLEAPSAYQRSSKCM